MARSSTPIERRTHQTVVQGHNWPWPAVYHGWVIIVALGLTTIISYGTTEYLFGVLLVPMSHTLQWSRASISGAYALGLILSGLLGLPIGWIVDRYGARTLMTLGSVLGGLCLIGLSLVQNLGLFYLLWAGGLGLANALTWYPVSFTVVANWFIQRRGTAFALLTLLGGLASPIFIPLAGALLPSLGWRGTVVVMGVVNVVVAAPLHGFVVRRHPEDMGLWPDGAQDLLPHSSTRPGGFSLSAVVRQWAFWILTVAYALCTLASSVLLAHTIAYLIDRGYDPMVAASCIGLVGLASLPGRLILNVLGDRLGSARILGLCLLTQAISILLLVQGASLGWLLSYVIVYGATYGAISPLKAAVMADRFGRRAYGAITAVQGVPVALCAGFGPLAAGWLRDQLGNYNLSFWFCAGAFVLAGLLVSATPSSTEESRSFR